MEFLELYSTIEYNYQLLFKGMACVGCNEGF
jgi:hypothetical protein